VFIKKFNDLLREIKDIGKVDYRDERFCSICRYSKGTCVDVKESVQKECKTWFYNILEKRKKLKDELQSIKQNMREIVDVRKIKEEIEGYNQEIKNLEVSLRQNLEYDKDVVLRESVKKMEKRVAKVKEDKNVKIAQRKELECQLEDAKAALISETSKMNQLKQQLIQLEEYLGVIENSEQATHHNLNEEEYYKKILDLNKVISDYEKDKFMKNKVREYLKYQEEQQRIHTIKDEITGIKLSIQRKRQEILAINDSEKIKEILSQLKLKDVDIEDIIKGVEKEINTREGANKQLAQNVKEYTLQLEEKIPNYSEIYTHTKILDVVLKDLDKSIKAIEKSVLKYYENKIEELNRNLKYLWSNTYKGNDIDKIELKAEITNSKYSYKLMMYKNDVELEMRGRCSAGQKVIASLIFRLALSITFSGNCNVLTLDEPTTNLDQCNIESLARTLKYLERMSNLQLVIITHDEEFLNLVSKDSVEYFYKVRRNSSCESVIERHSVY
ncbi:DNA repair protein RAD50, ABC-type ATPase/SMC superfamily, partial [Trachipleistophora hominis]